ncbi:OsmC family protein [Priestia megaterium]
MKFIVENEETVTAKHAYNDLVISPNQEKGFRPVDVLTSAIVGCASLTFKKITDKQRVNIKSLSVETQVKRILEEANRIKEIKIQFIVEGSNLSEVKIKKALDLTMKNCGMIQSVKEAIEIMPSFRILPSGSEQ